jgi:hypothetical protein
MNRGDTLIAAGVFGLLMLSVGYLANRQDRKMTEAPAPTPSLSVSPSREQEPSVSPEKEELSAVEPEDPSLEGPEVTSRENSTPQQQLLFRNPIIAEWIHLHPNGPHKLIPKDARPDEIEAYEQEAALILEYHERIKQALLDKHKDNLIAFCEDPDVLQNDRDRQMKLMQLVKSIWPKARTP